MPELPEVETVKRSLQLRIIGQTIVGLDVNYDKTLAGNPAEIQSAIRGQTISGLSRRGKYLMIHLDGGQTLVVHLRMTGRLVYCLPERQMEKHTHLVFILGNGMELRFTDPRKFGRVWLIPTNDYHGIPGLAKLGEEPLDEALTLGIFREKFQGRKRILKAMLLDQTVLAGIGNIYADEILFAAGLRPDRTAASLTDDELERLYHSTKKILHLGVTNRGTSIRDYVDGDGRSGNFQTMLQVYGHQGEACPRCGAVIIRQTLAGRSTHFCQSCQV